MWRYHLKWVLGLVWSSVIWLCPIHCEHLWNYKSIPFCFGDTFWRLIAGLGYWIIFCGKLHSKFQIQSILSQTSFFINISLYMLLNTRNTCPCHDLPWGYLFIKIWSFGWYSICYCHVIFNMVNVYWIVLYWVSTVTKTREISKAEVVNFSIQDISAF